MMPLNIYPYERWPEITEMVKEAKALLKTDIVVVPCPAVPGSGRVLALETPPFACEYALVSKPNVQSFVIALSVYLELTVDERWTTMQEWFNKSAGMKVKEIV
jgi:hypothetical protein